ncbi:MAG: acyl-CoA thioesterase [Xanthomonadaceae bacterium]|jgi:acyl-CoA thioester hydrolase|nr:acyl-CoA thioesterase [Xanthomonadaceae bacterium]
MIESATARNTLFRFSISVRWGDMDAFGHVNNTRYLGYLEEARVRWLAGIPEIDIKSADLPVMAASTLNYRRPIEWPSEALIELFVDQLGNSSITISHRIVSGKDESVLYCDGHVVMVWVNAKTGKSVPLPEPVRVACLGC